MIVIVQLIEIPAADAEKCLSNEMFIVSNACAFASGLICMLLTCCLACSLSWSRLLPFRVNVFETLDV